MKQKALYARRVAQGLAAGMSLAAAQAWAALPAGVTSAVTSAQADGIELGGLMLGLAVAVGVVFWLKRKV